MIKYKQIVAKDIVAEVNVKLIDRRVAKFNKIRGSLYFNRMLFTSK